jgi:hypothetical protein
MTREEAIKATRNGAVAMSVVGVLFLIVILVASFSQIPSAKLEEFSDPWLLIDVAIIFALAFGIYRKSRFAAVAALSYYLLTKIINLAETGSIMSGLFISFIVVYFLGKAIQGAFVYHRTEQAENPDYKKPSKRYLWILIPLGGLLTILIAFGLLISSGVLVEAVVRSGDKVPAIQKSKLRGAKILKMDETIIYFYSYGLISVLEGGAVLTDRGLTTYSADENDDLSVYRMTYEEMDRVEQEQQGDFFTDSVYVIYGNEKSEYGWLYAELSVELDRDKDFVEELESRIEK